jgi:RNA-directed DNA polymerase
LSLILRLRRTSNRYYRALATLYEVIAGSKVGWVLEADLKNFLGSLDHKSILRFVEHRVGDRRLISLIRRWLKANILEADELRANDEDLNKVDQSASC